jgi:hypothetical protein
MNVTVMSIDIICEKCGMAFVSRTKLKDHLTKVRKLGYFQCQSCNRFLDNEDQFRKHMTIHIQLQRHRVLME